MRVNMKFPGDCFGEVSLMYSVPRNATVAATQDSTVWVLERETFRCGAAASICRLRSQDKVTGHRQVSASCLGQQPGKYICLKQDRVAHDLTAWVVMPSPLCVDFV
jgi:CRP-like cAMP-binding protein